MICGYAWVGPVTCHACQRGHRGCRGLSHCHEKFNKGQDQVKTLSRLKIQPAADSSTVSCICQTPLELATADLSKQPLLNNNNLYQQSADCCRTCTAQAGANRRRTQCLPSWEQHTCHFSSTQSHVDGSHCCPNATSSAQLSSKPAAMPVAYSCRRACAPQ